MVNRILTEKVKSELLKHGMDLVGFGPVERWSNAPYLLSPQAVLPGCRTVVVAGIHITDTWTEMGGEPEPQDTSPGGWMDQNSLLDRVAYRTVRLLEDHGCNAVGIASSNIWRYREFDGIPSLFAPDLSHMHAAVAAGLAEMVWTGLAAGPEFGPRVRYISIVTDAELLPTPMYDGPAMCDRCMDCVKSCPSYAMKRDMNGKPHRVEIGGKVYEYANKNIWRCAWAEHFNLDLNSKTLEEEHVSEETVLAEIGARGTRGHERGVCQKICVPPHLRSEKPSFGRRDKQITLNRINRRYPDSMPTLRKMRDDIMGMITEWGADVVGVQALDQSTDVAEVVNKEAPGMQSIIAFTLRTPKEMQSREQHNSYSRPAYDYAIGRTVHHILLKAARMVEDYGYAAASYGSNLWHGTLPDAGALLAEQAGLGEVREGGFVSDEFGVDVVAGALVTDAPLDPIEQQEGQSWHPAAAPTGRRLRAKLEAMAAENQASLFGIADAALFPPLVEDLKKNIDESELGQAVFDRQGGPHGEWHSSVEDEGVRIQAPEHYLPEAKSVIVLGMHFPEALVKNTGNRDTQQIGTYSYWNYQTVYELRFAALALVRELGAVGYNTFVSENLLGVGSKVDSPRGWLPDARCNSIEAMVAGLGQVGKSGALLTDDYGPHQRCICIITDAPLPADKPWHGEAICKGCGNCESKCTMGAFDRAAFPVRLNGTTAQIPAIQRHRCDWAKRYSLHPDEGPALIGNNTSVTQPEEHSLTIEQIAEGCRQKDPVMKHRTCILEPCLRHCPA